MDVRALLQATAEAVAVAAPTSAGRGRLTDVRLLPARPADAVALPDDLPAPLPGRLALNGVTRLYRHQVRALELVREGRHVVVATGTASGKSLCYQLPVLERLLRDDRATALYLAPTKALARDQVRALRGFRLPHARVSAYDGDTSAADREAIRRTANVVLTNPDMLHAGLLPGHQRWSDFFARLALVVVDECHVARGVFGAHVAAVLRRLRRVCARHGAAPTFVLASATIGNPGEHAGSLTGLEVAEITVDGSPRPPVVLAMWEPPLLEGAQGVRRSLLTEAGALLAGLVAADITVLAFVRSRKGAELVAAAGRRALGERDGAERTILAYRAGHLPDERRAVERGLIDGSIRGVAATDALELGVDVGALDAVVVAGWPGTTASLWQQAGRAGRRGQEAAVVFMADDDPLDHYLLAHPDQLWSPHPEDATADLTNPWVLRPHLECAAAEVPLIGDDAAFAPADVTAAAEALQAAGRLRLAGARWHATARAPAARVSLRTTGGPPVRIVEAATGTLVGDVDEVRAHRTVHPGAVYLHQGRSYRVTHLDLQDRVATVRPDDTDEVTSPRTDTEVTVAQVAAEAAWGRCRLARGAVEVSTQVLGYERRHAYSGVSRGVVPLDLPRVRLVTQGLWVTIPNPVLRDAGLDARRVPGAAHAAEHAAIGLLPLFAMCDRWDVGGLSTAWHPDTGSATIFIFDAYPGGAGITERVWRRGAEHVSATLTAVASCACSSGCPSCVYSPKCGHGNTPLDKAGAVALLREVVTERAGVRRRA